MEKALEKYNELREGVEGVAQAIENMSSAARSGTLGLYQVVSTVKQMNQSMEKAMETLGGLGTVMLNGNAIGAKIMESFSLASDAMSLFGSMAEEAIQTMDAAGKGLDAVTSYNRELNKSMFEQTAAFGMGLDAAIKYGDYITKTAETMANASSGWVKGAELEEAMKAMTSVGIPLERMSDQVVTASGSFDLLTTAVLHSKSIGMSTSSYMENMSKLMNQQGLSTQKAAETMAMFGEVARDTGFKVSDVAGSLQGVANNFAKLGMSASFGAGILEGFTRSLKSVGIGFENALELSAGLSNSIGNLSSNYAMAYVTFQRGGLDFNKSGTALGASIGMRAEMLDAEKRGDQGQMGMQIAGAIKDTLASFTGGEILTVTEARDNPQLEALYFTQTELLKSMYGITDTAAQDRTLELLKQLGDATESGDTELAESLGKDIQETVKMRDETLSVQEKMETHLSNIYAAMNVQHRELISALIPYGNEVVEGVGKGTRLARGLADKAANALAGTNTPPETGAAAVGTTNTGQEAGTGGGGAGGGGTGGAAGGTTGGTQTGGGTAGTAAPAATVASNNTNAILNNLAAQISLLVLELGKNNNARTTTR
jgi:hypothetical protein